MSIGHAIAIATGAGVAIVLLYGVYIVVAIAGAAERGGR